MYQPCLQYGIARPAVARVTCPIAKQDQTASPLLHSYTLASRSHSLELLTSPPGVIHDYGGRVPFVVPYGSEVECIFSH